MDPAAPKSCLLSLNCMETGDELDQEFIHDKDFFLSTISGLSERESLDKLNLLTSSNPEAHKRVSVALLYVMLTDQSQAVKAWRDLSIVARDNLQTVHGKLCQLINVRFEKLLMPVKMQLIWILDQFISSNVVGSEQLFILLISCVRGGDIRSPNVLFTEQMIKLVTSQLPWITGKSFVLNLTVYTFLRLIVDHGPSQVSHLRTAEVSLTVKLIRENFSECMKIGRDFIRLLQGVSKIPEFTELWREILYSPQKLSPAFSGILQILSVRTSRRFIASRLTPEMESKLTFLATQVKFGNHQRYQNWFTRRYFHGPESETLVCDCIRYICCVIHPTNEILNSNIVPRWALLGWLLTTTSSNVMAAQAKLALFYDWFFYNAELDSIMNIEPGILIMNHALKAHPTIAATLMDFLIRMTSEFCPELQKEVWQGISNSFSDILEKKVIADLNKLVNHHKLDEELRIAFHKTFPLLAGEDTEGGGAGPKDQGKFSDDESGKTSPPPPPPPPPPIVNLSLEWNQRDPTPPPREAVEIHPATTTTPEEEYVPEFKSPPTITPTLGATSSDGTNGSTRSESPRSDHSGDGDGLSTLIDDLDPSIREEIRVFSQETDPIAQRTSFGNVISCLMEHPGWTRPKLAAVAKCLHVSLQPYFGASVADDDCSQVPLHHGIFQLLSILTKDKRPRIWKFLSEFYLVEPRVGYHLLYYLYSRAQLDLYSEFASFTSVGTLKSCLTEDLRICQEEDGPATFYRMIPELYQKFPGVTTGNANILHLIVSCIDSQQLHSIICNVMSKKVKIFNVRSISTLLRTTLEWETFEQYCVWQLLSAESVPSESVIDVLKDLKDSHHYELFSSMLVFLKSVKPTERVIKKLIALQNFKDQLVVPITVWWLDKFTDSVLSVLEGFLNSAVTNMDDKRLGMLVHYIEMICEAVDRDHKLFKQDGLWKLIKTSWGFISQTVKKSSTRVEQVIRNFKEGGEEENSGDDLPSEGSEDEEELERPAARRTSKRRREVLDSDEE